MDFHGIDLNLLVAFDALMNERNVTRAAARVGVSQPAMSAALARLRTLLGDALFLRSGSGLLPTARARDLAEPIAQALQQIAVTLVKPAGFDPATAVMTFKLGMPDYPAFILLPGLLQVLEQAAPGVRVQVHAANGRDHGVDMLDAGIIDAAIGVPPGSLDGRIKSRPLLADTFVTVVAGDHPAAHGMDLDTFLKLHHVLVSPEGNLFGVVDEALARLGRQRTLALTLPHMFAVPSVIARTRMTATLLRRVALHDQGSHQLAVLAPPVDLPAVAFDLMWHRRTDGHLAQQWFRDTIARQAAAL